MAPQKRVWQYRNEDEGIEFEHASSNLREDTVTLAHNIVSRNSIVWLMQWISNEKKSVYPILVLQSLNTHAIKLHPPRRARTIPMKKYKVRMQTITMAALRRHSMRW
jgi:hypothetical protein